MAKLPEEADWLLSNNWTSNPPFAVLRANFGTMTGSITRWKTVEQLNHIHRLGADSFWSAYSIDGKQGRFEAAIDDKGNLKIAFTTGPIQDTFTARPTRIEWSGRRRYSGRVAGLSYTDRLQEAIERALPRLPAEVAEKLRALVTLQSLSIMAATLAAWAVSHFFGVGEIADLVLIVAGGLFFGVAAADIASDLDAFAKHALGAECEEDLDIAGERLASAVAKGGVNLVSAILLRRFAQKANRPFRDLFQGRQPYSPRTGGALNSTPGKWFYRRKFIRDTPALEKPAGLRGNTSIEGDVWVSNEPGRFPTGKPMALERLKTYFHESMHSFLTPRLQFLRELRIQLRDGAYQRSYILRYLEEALAEAWGRFGTIGETPKAIRFPVDRGYVTVSKMIEEGVGAFQGPITVGGAIYRVFLANSDDDKPVEYEYDDGVATLAR
jgi:hypothetical protein